MTITLYYAPVTCAMVSWIMLNEVHAEFQTIDLNFRKKDHRKTEYLTINPLHKVPALVVNEKVLTENVAIIQWINATFPNEVVLPTNPWEHFKAISLLSWCSSGIHPFLTRMNNPKKIVGGSDNTDSVIQIATTEINECLQVADIMLGKKEFFFNNFSAVDVHFFWCCRRATQFGIALKRFRNVQRHFHFISQRQSVKKLLHYEASVIQKFETSQKA